MPNDTETTTEHDLETVPKKQIVVNAYDLVEPDTAKTTLQEAIEDAADISYEHVRRTVNQIKQDDITDDEYTDLLAPEIQDVLRPHLDAHGLLASDSTTAGTDDTEDSNDGTTQAGEPEEIVPETVGNDENREDAELRAEVEQLQHDLELLREQTQHLTEGRDDAMARQAMYIADTATDRVNQVLEDSE